MADSEPTQGRLLARLTVPAQTLSLSAVLGLVRDVAGKQGLDDRSVERLVFAVEEACGHVIEDAYSPEQPGTVDVEIVRQPARLVVAIEDQGLPFDFKGLEEEEQSPVAQMLSRAFDGQIHCVSLGRKGNRVELIKELPTAPVPAEIAREEMARSAGAQPAAPDAPLTIRLMRPDEAVGLVRCLYRTYGYSYDCDYMYEPEKVRALQGSGLMRSAVAVNAAGEIVGHLALNLERPDARVGEAAQAIVDPRYRGHGIFERLKTFLKEDARKRGMYGIYSEAVTIHPYSQKGNLKLGARETGLLLGYIPATVSYKEIEELQRQRQSVMLFFLKVNDDPARDVYPPPRHEAMVRRIYGVNGLPRNVRRPDEGACSGGLPASARVDVKVRTDHNEAFLRVRSFGLDLEDLVHFRLRELCLQRVDCIYLDLPLSDPATGSSCTRLEAAGFFFGGIIPDVAPGDVLRLQFLNNVAVDPAQVQVGSEHGKELLAYVLQAHASSPQVLFN